MSAEDLWGMLAISGLELRMVPNWRGPELHVWRVERRRPESGAPWDRWVPTEMGPACASPLEAAEAWARGERVDANATLAPWPAKP